MAISPEHSALLDRIPEPSALRALPESELQSVADAVRAEMIDAVSVTGGHLGSGLGVVELSVALHHVFDTPDDRIVWDVGHQAYPHKILTGRRDRIRTLRQGGGLSGFTKRSESVYDPFGAAHSSTSISAALGMAVARDLDVASAKAKGGGDKGQARGQAAQHDRGDRRRLAVGGDGLRGDEQRRRAALAADRDPQRQRHVDRPAGGGDVGLSRQARLGGGPTGACARRPSSWENFYRRRSTSARRRRRSSRAR